MYFADMLSADLSLRTSGKGSSALLPVKVSV